MEIHENIRALRKLRSISVRDISFQFGITPQAYRNIEKGLTDIQYSRLLEIAKYYDLTIDELIYYHKLKGKKNDYYQLFDQLSTVKGLLFEKSKQNKILFSVAKEAEKKLQGNRKKTTRSILSIGISAIFICVSFFLCYAYFTPMTNEQLFTEYYEPHYPSVVTRGDNQLTAFEKGLKYFADGENERALYVFDSLSFDSLGLALNYYKGIASLELKNYFDAINYLKPVASQMNLYNEDANWYLALCFLKTDSIEESRNCLKAVIDFDGYLKGKANSLLDKLV